MRTHRSALHVFGLPQSSRLGQEDSLAYVSELESLSPRKRFLCFHEAYTPKAYFEKKDKPTHGTPGDELLQEHQWLVGPWNESYSEEDSDAWGPCWCSGLKWSTPQPEPRRLPWPDHPRESQFASRAAIISERPRASGCYQVFNQLHTEASPLQVVEVVRKE